MTDERITYHFKPEDKEIIARNAQAEQVGEIDYRDNGESWDVTHTGVKPQYCGVDIARTLVQLLVDEARKANVKLSATCPYAVKVLERTEEYQDVYLKNRSADCNF